MNAFTSTLPGTKPLVVGTGGVPLETWFGST